MKNRNTCVTIRIKCSFVHDRKALITVLLLCLLNPMEDVNAELLLQVNKVFADLFYLMGIPPFLFSALIVPAGRSKTKVRCFSGPLLGMGLNI